MTGPEAYKDAADDLNWAEARFGDCTPGESAIASALVGVGRAVLALTAATALQHLGPERGMTEKDRAAWIDVASECRKAVTQ
jgi:hypothetical protein